MKRLFFILLFINLLFAGVAQLAVNGSSETGREHQPLNDDKIQIVADRVSSGLGDKNKPDFSAAEKDKVCFEWGAFSGSDMEQAQSALKTLHLGEGVLTQHNVEEADRFWVYIPPLKTKSDADKKISELKAMGVNDFLLMQPDGKWKYAISLGVFTTEEASVKFLAQLQKKGVKSAKSGPRNHETGKVKFQLNDVSEEVATQLVALKEDFKGSELKAVACQ